MKKVGGNTEAVIQSKSTAVNDIGENVPIWKDLKNVVGWLDLSAGDSRYTNFSSKIEESTHVFVMDYDEEVSKLKEENIRMVIGGKVYNVTLIDNPMNLNYQLEISLDYRGGQ